MEGAAGAAGEGWAHACSDHGTVASRSTKRAWHLALTWPRCLPSVLLPPLQRPKQTLVPGVVLEAMRLRQARPQGKPASRDDDVARPSPAARDQEAIKQQCATPEEAVHAMSMLSIHATINTCIPWPASESPEEPPAAAICVAGSPTMQQQLPSTRLRFSD